MLLNILGLSNPCVRTKMGVKSPFNYCMRMENLKGRITVQSISHFIEAIVYRVFVPLRVQWNLTF